MSQETALLVFSILLLAILIAATTYLMIRIKIEESKSGEWPGLAVIVVSIVILLLGMVLGSHPYMYVHVTSYAWKAAGMHNLEPLPFMEVGKDFKVTGQKITLLQRKKAGRIGLKSPDLGVVFLEKSEYTLPDEIDPKTVEIYWQHVNGRTSSSVPLVIK